MKKNIMFAILLGFIFFCSFINKVYAGEYHITTIRKDGTLNELASTDNYSDAKKLMYEQSIEDNNVTVIFKNNLVVNSQYAIVKFNPNNIVYLYQNRTDSSFYTAVHTSYGTDAAFIDYDPNTNRVKLKISGFTGWADLGTLRVAPLTEFLSDNIRITENIHDALNVRSEPSSSAAYIGYVTAGQVYSFTEKKISGGYTWYKINYNGTQGWVANVDNGITEDANSNLQTYYQYWGETGNLLHYYAYNTSGYEGQYYTNLGPAPSFLNKYQLYYSFDGIYFYDELIKMLEDYKTNSTERAVNKSPYYAYYLYLPNRSQTSYTSDDLNFIIQQKGYHSQPNQNIKYVDDNGNFIGGIDRNGLSKLVGVGQDFIDSQEHYGVNALLTFSAAINESATGTSAIAFAKNNLFGHNAYDSCPFTCSTTYQSVRDAIFEHARLTGENYNNPNHLYYHGSHYGNKGSGMNVMYATDPYWGEKAAQNYFLADNSYGRADYFYNTIGIKQKYEDIYVYESPNNNARIIYNVNNDTENVPNIPLIVLDKFDSDNTTWYKIYTEIGLDSNKNIVGEYDRKYSIGYVKADELFVSNNQPSIVGQDIKTTIGTKIDIKENVKAQDIEDGDITANIQATTDADFNKAGEYNVTYSVKDKSNFNKTVTYKIIVEPKEEPIPDTKTQNILEQISINKNKKEAWFYMDYLKTIDGNLYIKGYNTINGINNILENDIKYKMIFENIETGEIIYQDANRITDRNKINRVPYATDGLDYTYSWFEYKYDFSSIPSGNYKTYVIAYTDDSYSISVISNKLYKEQATSFVKEKSVVIYRDFGDRTGALEFNVRDNNLAIKNGSYIYNQYDTYRKFEFQDNKLHLMGVSYSYGMDLSKNANVTRKIIFEEKNTFKTYTYDLGSTTEGLYNVTMLDDDKLSKEKAWYNNTIDISNIPKGEYVIYITTTSNITDIAELTEKLGRKLDTVKATINGLSYNFSINYNRGNRIELSVK